MPENLRKPLKSGVKCMSVAGMGDGKRSQEVTEAAEYEATAAETTGKFLTWANRENGEENAEEKPFSIAICDFTRRRVKICENIWKYVKYWESAWHESARIFTNYFKEGYESGRFLCMESSHAKTCKNLQNCANLAKSRGCGPLLIWGPGIFNMSKQS
jgi:hypothetical protein